MKLAAAAGAIGDLALGQLTADRERETMAILESVTSHPELASAMRNALETPETWCLRGADFPPPCPARHEGVARRYGRNDASRRPTGGKRT